MFTILRRKSILLPIILMVLSGSSCSLFKKTETLPSAKEQNAQAVKAPSDVSEKSILEQEEKLVMVDNKPVDPFQYFVITGSFKNVENATKFQSELANDGFRSGVLRNEAGLYRVSVLGTDDVLKARQEVLRIRNSYPKYADVWLLIQKK